MDGDNVLTRITGRMARIAAACSLRVPPEIRDDLLKLQYRRVGVMVPIIYFAMAIIAAVASSASVGHFSVTYHVALPGFFLVIGTVRSIVWYRRRHDDVSPHQQDKRLRSTFLLAVLITIVGSGWTIDAYFNTVEARRVLAPIFLFMITFAGAICLTSLPRTAISVLIIAMSPSCVAMIAAQDIGVRAMGIGFAAIALMMIGMIAHNFAEIVSGLKLRRELKILSETDPLTGLANRRAFKDAFHAEASEGDCGIVMIDLDGFKQANDSFGHAAGDAILKEVAERLRSLFINADCIARLGGDEFAILLPCSEKRDFSELSGGILAALALPYHYEGHTISVGASLGLAVQPHDGQDYGMLMKMADRKLYQNKVSAQPAEINAVA